MQPFAAPAGQTAGGPQRFIVDLASCFAAALVDRKSGHGGDAIAALSQRFKGLRQIQAQGADHPSRRDCDASCFYEWSAKCHLEGARFGTSIPVDLSFEALY
jgi:hypothetical protein